MNTQIGLTIHENPATKLPQAVDHGIRIITSWYSRKDRRFPGKGGNGQLSQGDGLASRQGDVSLEGVFDRGNEHSDSMAENGFCTMKAGLGFHGNRHRMAEGASQVFS